LRKWGIKCSIAGLLVVGRIRVWNVLPISGPPFQTPHLRPPSQATISGPPPQTLHLRPPISGPKPPSSDPTLFE